MSPNEYDGIYFLPAEEDEYGMKLVYFTYKDGEDYGKPVSGNEIGHMYHVAFFRSDDDGLPVFDEHFEAIFADPSVYITGLAGSDLYGCVLRKTEKSGKWWDNYLKKASDTCRMYHEKLKTA